MNFKTASRVNEIIDTSEEVDRLRALNRNTVNALFDGFPPLSNDNAKKINMRINVNWMEGPVLGQKAEAQYHNAFLKQNYYFKVGLPDAPPEKKTDWELFLTRAINKPLKQSLPFYELMRSKFASVVRHGIGPQLWQTRDGWLPQFVALEDLRIPTDTTVAMDNLIWFAVRKSYTPWELARKVFGKNPGKGWQTNVVSKILDSYKDLNYQDVNYDWATDPEKMLELWKQDMGFFMSDAVPSIRLWHFYYLDEENKRQTRWKMKVVPAEFGVRGLERNTFLYDDDKEIFADDLSEIMHVQFGDLNGKAPFLYHSVRGLGLLLCEPCYWMNLTRCRFLQHVWENFNLLLRGGDPSDKARTQKVELFDKAFIPDGIAIVPQDQRHQIEPKLVEMVMGGMKQLMGEASSAYTQDLNDGTQKERTAFEVMTLMQQVNSMMASLLATAYQYEIFSYREICRRFCNKKSIDKDIRKFRKACKDYGIPAQYLDADLWEVTPDFPLGSGNQTLELAQAKQLMEIKPTLSPSAQERVTHMYVAAVTGNPKLAESLAPIEGAKGISDATRDAEFAFGTLMQGVPVRMKDGLNLQDQITTLLGLLAGVIAQLEKNGNMADAREVMGLQTVSAYIGQLIQQLSQDPAQKPLVKGFSDAYGKLNNYIKGFQQRLQEQMQEGNNGIAPEAKAKVDATLLTAQTKAKIDEAKNQQKMAHKQEGFVADQQRKDLQTVAEVNRTAIKENARLNGEKEQTS